MISKDEAAKYINWFKYLKVESSDSMTETGLLDSLKDGLLYLRVADLITKGVVDWTRVNMSANNTFR